MAPQDFWLLLALITGAVLGSWHLCWARARHDSLRGWWGRQLGFASIVCLGCTGFMAAGLRSPLLVPLGLLAGLLLVMMLWENSEPAWQPPGWEPPASK